MPSSGSKISDEVMKVYARVKKNSGSDKLPYAVFKFLPDTGKDGLTLVVDLDDEYYKKTHTYDELLGLMPAKIPKIIAFDFPHLNEAKSRTSSVMLVSWAPKDCPTREKLITAASFMSIVTALKPTKHVEGDDVSDLCEKEVLSKHRWEGATSESSPERVKIVLDQNKDDEQGAASN